MDNNSEVVYLNLDDIIPNRFQPREVFDDQALKELAVSIREHGVIQPIIVRKVEDKYEIIAGERRYKASTMAGLTKIPAIVKNLDDKESSKVALIENLQRKDLSPIEEARTYQKILELDTMTQEQLAATLGKTQSSVSNKLRLLDLPEEIQDALLKEKISERHARSILTIEDKNDQIKMMDKVIAEKMTVRELDKEIKILKGEAPEENTESTPQVVVENNQLVTETTGTIEEKVSDEPVNAEIFQVKPEQTATDNNEVKIVDLGVNKPEMNNQEQTGTLANPTSIDINKIRETAVDINANNTTANNTNNSGSEFKFVTSFGNTGNEQVTEVATEAPQIVSNEFDGLFNANTTDQSADNNAIPSVITTTEIAVPAATPSLDITQATNDLKTTLTNLQNQGFNITYNEVDGTESYTINVVINKN